MPAAGAAAGSASSPVAAVATRTVRARRIRAGGAGAPRTGHPTLDGSPSWRGRRPGDALHELVVHGARALQGRAGEGQARIRAADGHEAGAALLHDHVVAARGPAGLEPGVAGPERRMPGEGQL